VNIFRFRDRVGVLDERSQRSRSEAPRMINRYWKTRLFQFLMTGRGDPDSESAAYDQSLLEKPSFPQGRNCILHFDANIFPESLCISIVIGLLACVA